MSELQTQHEAHKARLARLRTVKCVLSDESYWPQMWFGDLIFGEDREDRSRITIDEIQEEVAGYFNLSINLLLCYSRSLSTTRPRQIAMYLCRHMTKHSSAVIARKFANRDHTTALHAFKKIDLLIKQKGKIANDVLAIRQRLDRPYHERRAY